MLDDLLRYHQTPQADDFTAQVMQGVQRQAARQQRLRRAILWGSGVVGAAFGVAGAAQLSAPMAQFFAATGPLELGVGVLGALSLLAWLLHEEVGLGG